MRPGKCLGPEVTHQAAGPLARPGWAWLPLAWERSPKQGLSGRGTLVPGTGRFGVKVAQLTHQCHHRALAWCGTPVPSHNPSALVRGAERCAAVTEEAAGH